MSNCKCCKPSNGLKEEYEKMAMGLGESYEEFLEDKARKYYSIKKVIDKLTETIGEAKSTLEVMEMTNEDFDKKIDSARCVINIAVDNFMDRMRNLGYKDEFIHKNLDIVFDDNLRYLEAKNEKAI